jgi:phage terminase large subunit-like protein
VRTINPKYVTRYASTVCTVMHQGIGRRAPLVLNREQYVMLQDLAEQRRTIILKGRQIGASTVCCLYDAMMALINPGIGVAIVADTADKSQRLLGLCRSFLQAGGVRLAVDNVRSIQLPNGSTIDAISAVSRAADGESRVGRSRSYGVIHCSEMAFWADDAATFASLTSTALPNARIVIESTATGADTLFRRIWADGDGWKHRFFSVEDHLLYADKQRELTVGEWKRAQAQYGFTSPSHASWWLRRLKTEMAGDDIRMLREYPVRPEHAFLAATGRWIREYQTADLLSSIGGWETYAESINPTVIGVDTATGASKDASAITVQDRVDGRLLATYRRDDVSIPDFVRVLRDACDRHRPAAVVVESNGIGAAVLQSMRETTHPVYEHISSASNGEKYTRLSSLRYLIESGTIPVAGALRHECEHAHTDEDGRYKGADDLLNALSFGVTWIDRNPHRALRPAPNPQEQFIPPHARTAKRVLF